MNNSSFSTSDQKASDYQTQNISSETKDQTPQNNPSHNHPSKKIKINKIILSVLLIIIVILTFLASFYFFSGKTILPLSQTKPSPVKTDPKNSLQNNTDQVSSRSLEKEDTINKISISPTHTHPTVQPLPTHPDPLINFHINAENDSFTPDTIHAELGQIISLIIKAVDRTYDFYIPDLNLSIEIQQGKEKVLQFQAVRKGQFDFFCPTHCNDSTSPKGKLTIE